MRTSVLIFRGQDKNRFEEVRSGLKSIETRAGTEKYKKIEVGDELQFKCGKDVFSKRVIKKYHWSTIEAMLSEVPLKRVMPELDTIAQVRARYASYPNYIEKIRQHGLLGFELA